MPIEDSQFQGFGIGTRHKRNPISVRFPVHIEDVLNDKAIILDRQQFIRDAVEDRLKALGLLPASTD